ncbi:MAG: hypothetical protein WAQ22_01225 [Candidatus Saccharimonas sp.]
MIDLLQFFLTNCDSKSYYYKFYPQLSGTDATYYFMDNQEILDRFRAICKPPDDDYYANDNEFILMCFWLHRHGYKIKEFPNLLSRPSSLRNFAYDNVRRYIQTKRGTNGTVLWDERRNLCDTLTITSDDKFQILPNEVEDKIRLISTRGAGFDGMAVDEQLQNLNNLIENILKPRQNSKYLTIDYDNVFFGFISEDGVKQYRKRTQPFRHATEGTLLERASIAEDEKKLLVHLGVFIAVHLYNYLNKNTRV